jgi:hypothetical protein
MKKEPSPYVTTVAIITRRLKKGKTYEDFRKLWYHSTGFGVGGKGKRGSNHMYSMINMFDEREVVVVGISTTTLKQFQETLKIEVEFRGKNPLDSVIEPEIGRKFYALISEDDFSSAGKIDYRPPAIAGKETNLKKFNKNLLAIRKLYATAAKKRDEITQARKIK